MPYPLSPLDPMYYQPFEPGNPYLPTHDEGRNSKSEQRKRKARDDLRNADAVQAKDGKPKELANANAATESKRAKHKQSQPINLSQQPSATDNSTSMSAAPIQTPTLVQPTIPRSASLSHRSFSISVISSNSGLNWSRTALHCGPHCCQTRNQQHHSMV